MLPTILTVPDSSLDAYLKTIRTIPLLTAAEEQELGYRIQGHGDLHAATLLTLHNLRLAASMALRGMRSQLGWMVQRRDRETETVWSVDDAVQAANMGLWTAVFRFDPTKGFKFSTYATWWIRQSLGRLAEPFQYPVYVPTYMQNKLHQLLRAQMQAMMDLGRVPLSREIAERAGWSLEEVRACETYLGYRAISVDMPLSEDDETYTLAELVADPEADLFEQLEQQLLVQAVHEALGVLPARSAAMVMAYYGIGDDHPRTLEEVGRHYNLTRERIRQIIATSLKTLRTHPQALAALSGWVEDLAS